MGEFLRIAASGIRSTTQPRVSLNRVYVRALALCALLLIGCAANAAVVSFTGPDYGATRWDFCSDPGCITVNPLPNIEYHDYWSPEIGYSMAVSVASPASASGVGVQLVGSNSKDYGDSIISYVGRIYTFQVDAPIFFNALNGSTFVRTSTLSYDDGSSIGSYDSGFSAGWRLCAGPTSQTMCAASATPGLSWQSPNAPANGTFSAVGPYVQLAPGTYSVWAYLGHSYPNGGPEFGEAPLQSTTATFNVNVSLSSVPIPAAAWLFGSGLVLLGWIRRKANA